MTKKDLERRNHYLLLQLKLINEAVKEISERGLQDRKYAAEKLGHITYYTEAENIKREIRYIEYFNAEYNMYEPTVDIREYLD